jgi:phosphonate transport system ATP-binding protein
MEILSAIQKEDGRTVVVSLHQVDMAIRYCPRVVALHQGRIVFDGPSTELTPVMLRDLYGMQADELLEVNDRLHLHAQPANQVLAWPVKAGQAA